MIMNDVIVYTQKDNMYLSFACPLSDVNYTTSMALRDLKKCAIKFCDGWMILSEHSLIKTSLERGKIVIKEYDPPVGPYGKCATLKSFPFELLRLGFVDVEEAYRVSDIIANSLPVLERQAEVAPSFASFYTK